MFIIGCYYFISLAFNRIYKCKHQEFLTIYTKKSSNTMYGQLDRWTIYACAAYWLYRHIGASCWVRQTWTIIWKGRTLFLLCREWSFRSSKTIQFKDRQVQIPLARAPHHFLCPASHTAPSSKQFCSNAYVDIQACTDHVRYTILPKWRPAGSVRNFSKLCCLEAV